MADQKKYKIKIDRNLCIGAASCVALAMKTFALDSENKAIILENAETGEQEYP